MKYMLMISNETDEGISQENNKFNNQPPELQIKNYAMNGIFFV